MSTMTGNRVGTMWEKGLRTHFAHAILGLNAIQDFPSTHLRSSHATDCRASVYRIASARIVNNVTLYCCKACVRVSVKSAFRWPKLHGWRWPSLCLITVSFEIQEVEQRSKDQYVYLQDYRLARCIHLHCSLPQQCLAFHPVPYLQSCGLLRGLRNSKGPIAKRRLQALLTSDRPHLLRRQGVHSYLIQQGHQ